MIEPFDKDIYYKNGLYIIKQIVCDYEIIDLRNNEEPKMILNCFHNAKLICDILKADELHEHFKFEQKPIEIAQIEHLQKELALYKKALELACESYIDVDGISYVIRDSKDYWEKNDEQVLKETIDYFIKEAKEEIDEQKASEKERKE